MNLIVSLLLTIADEMSILYSNFKTAFFAI